MQEQLCESCQSSYDYLHHAPLKLPCSHTLCQNCIYNQFQKTKSNICIRSDCQKISYEQPRTLQEDKQILNSLQQRENQLQSFKKTLQQLKEFQDKNRKTLQAIYRIQSLIVKNTIQLVQKILLKCSNPVSYELQNSQKTTQQQIIFLEHLIYQQEKQNSGLYLVENSQNMLNSQLSENLIEKGNLQVERLQHLQSEIPKQLESFLQNLDTQNLQATHNQYSNQEISSNTEKKIRYQGLLNISTVIRYTNKKCDFKLDENVFSQNQINIKEVEASYTQIEQIGEQNIIISGSSNKNFSRRFTVFDNGDLKEFKMIYGRQRHRTVFNHQQKILILSGDSQKDVQQCEIFNLQNSKFTQICNILQATIRFGAIIDEIQKVYAIGGNNQEKIQVYDCITNSWSYSTQLPYQSQTTAGYIQKNNLGLIYYNNGGQQIDTLIFDFKSFSKHGEKIFSSECHSTQPIVINDKLYQFDCDTKSHLFVYLVSNAEWTTIK